MLVLPMQYAVCMVGTLTRSYGVKLISNVLQVKRCVHNRTRISRVDWLSHLLKPTIRLYYNDSFLANPLIASNYGGSVRVKIRPLNGGLRRAWRAFATFLIPL